MILLGNSNCNIAAIRRAVAPMRPNAANNVFQLISRVYILFLDFINFFKGTLLSFPSFSVSILLIKMINFENNSVSFARE